MWFKTSTTTLSPSQTYIRPRDTTKRLREIKITRREENKTSTLYRNTMDVYIYLYTWTGQHTIHSQHSSFDTIGQYALTMAPQSIGGVWCADLTSSILLYIQTKTIYFRPKRG